jgi:hypothetical protein
VSDGTHAASIILLGNYTAASFTLSQESGGTGTLVTDPPPVADANPIGPVAPHHT